MKTLLQLLIYSCFCTTLWGAEIPQPKPIFKNDIAAVDYRYINTDPQETQQFKSTLPHGEYVTDVRTLYVNLLQTHQFAKHIGFDTICSAENRLIVFKAFLNRIKQYYSVVCYLSGACATICIRSE